MFQIGDIVICPGYGAGTVVGIDKLQSLGGNKLYYAFKLSDESSTRVWIPVGSEGQRRVRHLTPMSQLDQVWHVLRADPEGLSSDRDKRHEPLQEKLRGGDVFQVAEVVRDMFWEDHRSRGLNVIGKELYDRGLMLLTSEVAAVQGCDLVAARAEISSILGASLAAKPIAR